MVALADKTFVKKKQFYVFFFGNLVSWLTLAWLIIWVKVYKNRLKFVEDSLKVIRASETYVASIRI